MAEDDVRLEVEAVLSVYGNDCNLIQDFPPHLTVRIKPRTAEDSSQETNHSLKELDIQYKRVSRLMDFLE
ncbi:hypothetical protein HPP92_022101 [Vanilla planifolia]|uniref:RWD domain-containing protein n=1 Tax=Vanilla planifolia TaxID=51239 RepID=A0A835PSN4_VANPL|nr:hypothetical protein HPP92_022101 [Vanilla planifolia]